jgi:hypothetical protein
LKFFLKAEGKVHLSELAVLVGVRRGQVRETVSTGSFGWKLQVRGEVAQGVLERWEGTLLGKDVQRVEFISQNGGKLSVQIG